MFLRKQKAAHLIIQVQFKHPERPRGYLSHFTAVIDHSDLFFNDLIFRRCCRLANVNEKTFRFPRRH